RPQPGDVYLLCSDGLSDMVTAAEIEEILRSDRNALESAARSLVRAANRGGGDDNITAVLFEIVDGDAQPGEPDEKTREYTTRPLDEEDTLHPEDGVVPPPAAEAPSPFDTMVIPAGAIDTQAEPAAPE